MAQTKKDNKILLYDESVYDAIKKGTEYIYESVATTYGPKGKNVLIEKVYGRPVLTRDGVTVAKETYSSDRAENAVAHLLSEASQATNRIAGDGTTATVILARNLIREGLKLISGGHDPMQLRDQINKDSVTLLDAIAAKSQDVVEGQLVQVATVSSGDPLLGKMIAEAVERVGYSGGIITEKAHISGVEREYVDGYYLENSGFTAITEGKRELEDTYVVVSAKRLASHIDALSVLQVLAKAANGQRIKAAFIGDIEGDAYKTIVANIMQGKLDAVIVGTPSTGDMGVHYLEDIALYTGAKLLAEGDNISSFDATFIGHADRVICTQSTTSIFSSAGSEEDIAARIAQLQDRIAVEESEFLSEKIRDRQAKLEGKIALFKIGGATEVEKEEKEFRIEDAIQASRAAYGRGVVPGGGTTLLRLSQLEISPMFSAALVSTFKKLMENASLPADVKANDILNSKEPMGFNLRGEDKLVDLVKDGILDPTLVIEQVITNAASTAGNVLTIGCFNIFEDREKKD